MKRIAIIGAGSVGMAIHKVLNAQMSNAEFVVVGNIEEAQRVVGHSPFAPEPFPIKAPPPMPEICYFNPLNEGKRTRTIRREQERKKKRKR